jgi:hypothetical protein
MIGVQANPGEEDAVREFFQLLKTPWEFSSAGRRYDVLLTTTGDSPSDVTAKLIVRYAGERTAADGDTRIEIDRQTAHAALTYGARRLPIYGRRLTFRGRGIGLAAEEDPRALAACLTYAGDALVVRVGYDLFQELRRLLTQGQPPANAGIPTLDLHIALLRELIAWSGTPLVEVPPVPAGHPMIACLTHDVDHPSVRRHRWDHTTFGFLYRACVGSVINVCRGRAPVGDLLANWAAALRLPFVHLGLARDFWCGWPRYMALDAGGGSTFFVIPVRDYAGGTSSGGPAPKHRAARYGARDIADDLRRLTAAGCEIGVHGIDAWLDSSRGREELAEVARVTGASGGGVRMHWLYGSERSPVILEDAGFAYDATGGYNETIGYRAGTTQVFKPLGAKRLLALPLHVMDTALFYPAHLHLSPAEARRRVGDIIDHADRFGGTVTVNWHDRSIAPERLWARVYAQVVRDLKNRAAWFPTASQAVAWFRKRRSAVFESVGWNAGIVSAKVSVDAGDGLPGLRLRIHPPAAYREGQTVGTSPANRYVDVTMERSIDTRLRIC